MSEDKAQLRQRISQLESDLRVCRAALAEAQAKLAEQKPVEAEAPRRGRPPKKAE